MTVLEVIQRSSEFLARKGVESPRLQVELLLAQVLKLPRLKLYLNFERPLTEPELERLRGLVQRRGSREPLQHILGSVSFCGLELAVSRHVLVPRPETELLAERAWTFLARLNHPQPRVLDFGTGSGCLAIALARHCPQAIVWALDLSEEALILARQNAQQIGVADRIRFQGSDGLAALPPATQFELVVSNPPYIPTAEIETLQPEVRDFDPRLALNGGEDGLRFYRLLAEALPPRLAEGGKLMVEFGDGQLAAIQNLLECQKWIVEASEADYSGRPRFLVACRPQSVASADTPPATPEARLAAASPEVPMPRTE